MNPADYYLVDATRGRLLGAPPKAGSSSLKGWLLASLGRPFDPADPHAGFPDREFTLSRARGGEGSWPAFLLVRDPAERLASAWRSKPALAGGVSFEAFLARLEALPGLDGEDPHWRPQSWFRLPGATPVPLRRLAELCPGAGRLNRSPGPHALGAELRGRALALYAADARLYAEALAWEGLA